MVKFLCENGAQIFAETYPDNDTGKKAAFYNRLKLHAEA
jgi:hypothetical protein